MFSLGVCVLSTLFSLPNWSVLRSVLILFIKLSNIEKYWCYWNFLYFTFLLFNSHRKLHMNIPFLNQSCNKLHYRKVFFHLNDFYHFKKAGQILKYLWLFSSCFKCNIIPTHYRKEALPEMLLAVNFFNK